MKSIKLILASIALFLLSLLFLVAAFLVGDALAIVAFVFAGIGVLYLIFGLRAKTE